MKDSLRIAMLISGGGTTMEQILMVCRLGGRLFGKVRPVLVIGSKHGIKGLDRAMGYGLELGKDIFVLEPKCYPDPSAFGEAILTLCQQRAVDLIGQYGWLPRTPVNVVETYRDRMINQHPGPLRPGRFGFGGKGMMGTAVHTAVLWFARNVGREFPYTEAVAQRVAITYDEGVLLNVRQVPILQGDDVSSLQERVLPQEHEIQVETLLAFAENRVQELDLPDIVLPEEADLLDQARKIATTLYPHG
ncbi:MAG: formyltransferase family protein [bacterium]|nr:formyltransferase family protein [bacterium]